MVWYGMVAPRGAAHGDDGRDVGSATDATDGRAEGKGT